MRLLSLMFVTAVCVFKYCHVINTVNQTNEILVKAMFPFQYFYFHSLLVLGPAVTFYQPSRSGCLTELIPVSLACSIPEYCYSPLDGILVHRWVISQQYVDVSTEMIPTPT